MSDALVVQAQEEEEQQEDSVHLIARTPSEIQASQLYLQNWLEQKVKLAHTELRDVRDARDIAKERKWGFSALDRQVSKAVGFLTYYKKLLAAVKSGYTIVPNFPLDFFAVRVKRADPKRAYVEIKNASTWEDPANQISDENPQILPEGEGRYVNPSQLIRRDEVKTKNEKGQEVLTKMAWPTDFQNVVFPLVAARPEVMGATADAMSLKVFDAVGICPPTAVRKGDPLIVGKI